MTRKNIRSIRTLWQDAGWTAHYSRQEQWRGITSNKQCAAQEVLFHQYVPATRYATDGECAAIKYLTRKVKATVWDWLLWMLDRCQPVVFARYLWQELLGRPFPDPEAY